MSNTPAKTSTPVAPGPAPIRGKYNHDTVTFEVCVPHEVHWLINKLTGSNYMQVEGVVHRVCRYAFEELSQSVFRDMFSVPQAAETEPTTDPAPRGTLREGDSFENPIKLPDCKNEEFESLMSVLYPRWVCTTLHSPFSLPSSKQQDAPSWHRHSHRNSGLVS